MPIFEYHCPRCDRTFEVLVSREEADCGGSIVCPTCGKAPSERLLSAFAVGTSGEDACERCPSQDSSMCCGGGCELPD